MVGWRLGMLGVLGFVTGALACFASSASALPNGRLYEMVSPVYKAGYGVSETVAVAPGGESLVFTSLGGFDGILSGSEFGANDYLAQRGSSGWAISPLRPLYGEVADVSSDLLYVLANAPLGPDAGVVKSASEEDEFLLHDLEAPNTAESWDVFGGVVLKPVNGETGSELEDGASPELCHVVLRGEGPLTEEARKTAGQIYDLNRGCDGEQPSLGLVGVRNKSGVHNEPEPINRGCEVELGLASGTYAGSANKEQESGFNAIAANGREIFFTAAIPGNAECSRDIQLYVRLGGAKTLEVSRPLNGGACVGGGVSGEVPCQGAGERANAFFKGASEDGSKVFFTTREPLTGEATGGGSDLYMATIGCPAGEPGCEMAKREVTALTRVSRDLTAGQAAEVQGVVKIAPNGGRVYFVAHGVLSDANAEGHAPVAGADNLYVYDSTTQTMAFVADLCSGPALSGAIEDIHCPADIEAGGPRSDDHLWGSLPEAQTAGSEGGVLVFTSYGQLTTDDRDNAKDVYRYEAATGRLERVSIGEAGADANGNDSAFGASIAIGFMGGDDTVVLQQEMKARAISEDGTRIVFTSAGPLSPQATNGTANVYEWHDGSVSLISSGTAEEADEEAVISPSGRDIFFNTTQGLVPQDTQGDRDIYDAHECSAQAPCFSPSPVEREPCSGDACQGSLTNPAPLLVPGSFSQAPGGNFPPPKKVTTKTKPLTVAQKLARALKACAKQPQSRRAACRGGAHKKYAKATKSSGRGRR
jgi:hypothetical protein